MRLIFIILLLSTGIQSRGQCIDSLDISYPGGEVAWEYFVRRNFNYDAVTRALNNDAALEFADSVDVRFVVNNQGNIESADIVRKGFPALETAVLAVVKKEGRWKWIPGIRGFANVGGVRTYRFHFTVSADLSNLKTTRIL